MNTSTLASSQIHATYHAKEETNHVEPFIKALYGADAAQDFFPRYPNQDFNRGVRHSRLRSELQARSGAVSAGDSGEEPSISAAYVVENAAERYFQLLELERKHLAGMFDRQDMQVILNANCGALWEWDPQMSVASAVADNNGVTNSCQLSADSHLRKLLKLLVELTPLQNAALVDVCETVWRDRLDRSLAESMLLAGLELRAG